MGRRCWRAWRGVSRATRPRRRKADTARRSDRRCSERTGGIRIDLSRASTESHDTRRAQNGTVAVVVHNQHPKTSNTHSGERRLLLLRAHENVGPGYESLQSALLVLGARLGVRDTRSPRRMGTFGRSLSVKRGGRSLQTRRRRRHKGVCTSCRSGLSGHGTQLPKLPVDRRTGYVTVCSWYRTPKAM